MANFTGNPDSGSGDYFAGLFVPGPSFVFSVTFSAISVPLIIGVLYSVIWFERFGSDLKRTLMNRLVSSVCWTAIEYFICGQTLDFVRYVYGPLPSSVCVFEFYMKNTLAIRLMLFSDAIVAIKYLSVFKLKNPFGFQDEFWHLFTCIWIVFFSHLLQFVLEYLPGPRGPLYHVCTGVKYDVIYGNDILRNRGTSTMGYLSVMVYIFYYIRIQIYKLKHRSEQTTKSKFLLSMEKESLTDLSTSLCFIGSILGHAGLITRVSNLKSEELVQYPNYNVVYFFHHGSSFLFCASISAMHYVGHSELRNTLLRKVTNVFRQN